MKGYIFQLNDGENIFVIISASKNLAIKKAMKINNRFTKDDFDEMDITEIQIYK